MSDAGRTYREIVLKQFRKNRVAVVGFWGVVLIFTLAVFAPALATSSPYRLQVGDGPPEYPWFRDLFDRHVFRSPVDIFFNLLMVLALPVAALLLLLPRRRGRVAVASAAVLLWLFLSAVGPAAVVESRVGKALFFPQAALRYSRPKRIYLQVREPELLPLLAEQRIALGERSVARARDALAAAERQAAAAAAGSELADDLEGVRRAAEQDLKAAQASLALWRQKREEALALAADPKRRVRTTMPPIGYHHDDNDNERIAEAPSWTGWGKGHFLGTDTNGRDVLARLLYGARVSMTIGVLAVALYCTIGTILGSLMGYFGGWVDMLGGRIVEVMICFPHLPFILILVGITGSKNIFMIMAAIGLISWPGVARLIRGQFLTERGLDYVFAARSLGIPDSRIVFRHVLPNAIHPMFVSATFGVASAILLESSLAFLGLGDPQVPSWGQLLMQGRQTGQLWLILSPGAAIFFTVIVLNLVGEGLRDALDPRLRR